MIKNITWSRLRADRLAATLHSICAQTSRDRVAVCQDSQRAIFNPYYLSRTLLNVFTLSKMKIGELHSSFRSSRWSKVERDWKTFTRVTFNIPKQDGNSRMKSPPLCPKPAGCRWNVDSSQSFLTENILFKAEK